MRTSPNDKKAEDEIYAKMEDLIALYVANPHLRIGTHIWDRLLVFAPSYSLERALRVV